MQAGEIYLVFTEPIDALGLDYLVTGSVASSSYGEPRFTHDIDLVVSLPPHSVQRFWDSFPTEDFYCPPLEALEAEVNRSRGGHFNLVHHETGFKADVYLAFDDELTRWAFEKGENIEILPGRRLRLAPPEYVILGKLQFYSEGGGERHIRDIRAMLELSADRIDSQILSRWIRELDIADAWALVRGE